MRHGVSLRFLGRCSGHPRPPSVEALAYRGCPCRDHQCATESRVTLWQSANPVRAVGASLVVLSSLAKVFVSLSSVVVFHIVKLVIHQTIVTLVF